MLLMRGLHIAIAHTVPRLAKAATLLLSNDVRLSCSSNTARTEQDPDGCTSGWNCVHFTQVIYNCT